RGGGCGAAGRPPRGPRSFPPPHSHHPPEVAPMTLTWLSRRHGAQTRRRTDPGLGSRPGRLRLECLEDRVTPSTFTVNTTLDEVTPGDGKLSLREAITRANTHPGADTIVLPAGVFKIALDGAGEDSNATGDFDITDSVTIRGAGAALTAVDGQQKI